MSDERRQPRKRTMVSPRTFDRVRGVKLVFRYSPGRDACILRVVGHRFGPVIQKKE
jgi:hypothetical protein